MKIRVKRKAMASFYMKWESMQSVPPKEAHYKFIIIETVIVVCILPFLSHPSFFLLICF